MTRLPGRCLLLCSAPALVFPILLASAPPARAFGDEGHQVVALVARANLTPRTAAAVDRLLKTDHNAFRMRDGGLTSDSFERQATWADYYRDSQRGKGSTPERIHSYSWHFVDIELQGGSLDTACFGFPKRSGVPASQGADPDCVVDKIEQFAEELRSPEVGDDEKLLALKFLLHFVGDLHQPLHASDNLDHGGNSEQATVPGGKPAALHSHWDTTFVERVNAPAGTLVTDPHVVAASLRTPSDTEKALWLGRPDPRYWALESYALSQSYVYGPLPKPTTTGTKVVYALDAKYVANATTVIADQLDKAGYRLAALLNAAFDH